MFYLIWSGLTDCCGCCELTERNRNALFLYVFSSQQSESIVTLTCADGKWNKQVTCEPVDCGRPDKYHVHPAVFEFSEGTTYGKKCTFQCREPAQLVGG